MCHLNIKSNILSFAEDITLYYSVSNLDSVVSKMKGDPLFADWLSHNKLILDVNKSTKSTKMIWSDLKLYVRDKCTRS